MFTVKLKEDQISAALERLARAMSDMSPVMDSIGEGLMTTTRQRFFEGVSPDGVPWAPKSQATIDAYIHKRGLIDDHHALLAA